VNAEEVLIKKASSGSLEAFNQLVLIYQNLAHNHAFSLLGDRYLAEDATQESFIKAFQGIKKFLGGSFRAWLLKIVTNTAYDRLRELKRRPALTLFPEDDYGDELDSPAWLADPTPSVQNMVEQNELSETLYCMVNELPVAYRSVLILVDVYELDYVEAARALGIPIGTVKSRLARARLQMRKKLQGFEDLRKFDLLPDRMANDGTHQLADAPAGDFCYTGNTAGPRSHR
jgi:RNA polymerase sigma-70 factor (ECF subfamily)